MVVDFKPVESAIQEIHTTVTRPSFHDGHRLNRFGRR